MVKLDILSVAVIFAGVAVLTVVVAAVADDTVFF